MKYWQQAYFGLLYALPAVLFFSYYPLISFGSDATMNFELSLPLIWLVLFDIAAFVLMILANLAARREQSAKLPVAKFGTNFPGLSDRKFFLFALFPLFVTLSMLWSPNLTRAILTAGILWLVFFAVFAIVFLTPLFSPHADFRRNVLKSLFLSTAAVCLFCWLQCILDLAGVSREHSLLCMGCTYRTFGFPHPSGFAIEPQFMGNLLLAPTFTALYLLAFRSAGLRRQPSKAQLKANLLSRKESRWTFGFAIFFSATLFVTMSRGAIYAYGIGLIVLLLFVIVRYRKTARWPNLIVIPVITFVMTLCAQGIFAAVSPTSDTFVSGVAKVIHQLSLGLIDFRPQTDSSGESESSASQPSGTDSPVESEGTAASTAPDSAFDGYVAASTNVRLGLNDIALQTWLHDPSAEHYLWWAPPFCDTDPCTISYGLSPLRMLFGVGIGGAGVAMAEAFPDHELIAPNAIVQNEPISLLLETGLIGIALLILILVLAFRPRSEFWSHPALPLLVSLILAYAVTLNFFSGFANALQIYLIPPLLYLCFKSQKTLAKS